MNGEARDYFLADDLSGALDAAAAFHHAGRRVRIALSLEAWAGAGRGEVVGFTTETRNEPPGAAAAAVARAIAFGHARGERLVFKKIDSTLRGPVAAELAALTATLPDARILFTPANPHVGRTVRDGVLLVHGIPVAQTDFARDPASPVTESSIRALLGEAATPRVSIVDASQEADLEAAVEQMRSTGGPWVAVGSGALARPVANVRAGARLKPVPGSARIPPGGVLLVGGSAHRANRVQVEQLAQAAGLSICEVRVGEPDAAVNPALEGLRRDGGVILQLESARTESGRARGAMTHAAELVIRRSGVARIFATGGETAFAICRALEFRSLLFREELEAGLSVSEVEAGGRRFALAIKPGGFGDAGAWTRAWHALRAV
ncbi:MAG: four-carbon acid sugar kinase family protein [Opitutus sp.]